MPSRLLLIVTAVVAAGLGLWRCADPEFHLSKLVVLFIAGLLLASGFLIAIFGNWSARSFALGFALGMMLEWHLVRCFLGGRLPQGPYSSTMICHQMLMTPGDLPVTPVDLIWAESFWWLVVGGTMISGIVGGTALLLVWLVGRRVIQARRKRNAPGGAPQ